MCFIRHLEKRDRVGIHKAYMDFLLTQFRHTMISTVTTTVTTVATLAAGAGLGVLATVLLISMLSTKEVVSADTRLPFQRFGRSLNITILPLLFVFSLIVMLEVVKIL